MDDKALIGEAIRARQNSWAPYSHFMVGASLLSKSGKIYCGCNVENASYGASNCAERTAFFKAVSEGEREFSAIAVAGWAEGDASPGFAYPCGICRQVMMEFCAPEEFRIIVAAGREQYAVFTLKELLPHGFGSAGLGG